MRLFALIMLPLLLTGPRTAYAQLSPGPLSSSHANLEGVLQCTTCHAIGLGRQELKCSSCHTEILQRVKNHQGYHGRTVDVSKGDSECVTCHKEHVGRDFELIRWPGSGKSSFDHNQTGYTLAGKHAALMCTQCHNAKNIDAGQKNGILMKNLDRSFLGLKTDCLGCHTDTHRGALGSNCTSCHTQDAWKPANGFDHGRTKFPLTGLHSTVSCQQCHKGSSGELARFTKLDFAECTDCHRDPHRGAFENQCTQCHSTNGWNVKLSTLSSKFDHSRTRYPLLGKHSNVTCSSCHKTSNFSADIATDRCMNCHADKHNKQFALRPDRGDCASCHTVDSFKTSTFDVAAHALTKYPLLGKHAKVACEDCHGSSAASPNYHPVSDSCSACHRDVHAGQFEARFGDKCDSCHVVEGFTPSTFSLSRHQQSRFSLTGAHIAVACSDCHTDAETGTGTGKEQPHHRYVFEDQSCTGCHKDPHAFVTVDGQCDSCHTQSSWKPTQRFDHSKTSFSLLGAHRAVDCVGCHKKTEAANHEQIHFSGAPETCSGCHQDEHAGQFAARFGSDCSSCHAVTSWKPASGFNHAESKFVLDGAHRNVRCVLCHEKKSQVAGKEVLVYANAPTECAQCH